VGLNKSHTKIIICIVQSSSSIHYELVFTKRFKLQEIRFNNNPNFYLFFKSLNPQEDTTNMTREKA